jgi:hypothetical protein
VGVCFICYLVTRLILLRSDYYGYFTPIREYMPQNCSSDVQAVIAYLDQLYSENNTGAMQSLKEAFGLGGLSHIDDFASARKSLVYLLGTGLILTRDQSSAI